MTKVDAQKHKWAAQSNYQNQVQDDLYVNSITYQPEYHALSPAMIRLEDYFLIRKNMIQ